MRGFTNNRTMLAIGRIERQLPLPGRDWLARVGLTVALAASLGTVQVAVFWLEGVFQGASEAIAASPAPGGVSCGNCGWWPWQDRCLWVEYGDQRGVSFSEPQLSSFKEICNPTESTKDLTWKCNCLISLGEKLYKWMPAVKVALTLPPARALQAFQITGDWDANTTVTKAMFAEMSGLIPAGKCGPNTVYCYRARTYVQTLYRRQLGTVTGVTAIPFTDQVNYAYSYAYCDAPCVSDYSVLEGPPSPQLSFTVYIQDHQPPLADACRAIAP